MKTFFLTLFLLASSSISRAIEWNSYIYLNLENTNFMTLGMNNTAWFITENRKVIKYDGIEWKIVRVFPSNTTISCIKVDLMNNLWLGTLKKGAYKFDGTTWTNYSNQNSQIAENYITTIEYGSNFSIWFGTNSNGVSKLENGNWTTFNQTNSGISGNTINDIQMTLNGDVIFLVKQKGFSILKSNNSWENTTPAGLSFLNLISAVSNSHGDIYAITANSNMIYTFSNNNWTSKQFSNWVTRNHSKILIDGFQHLWINGANSMLEIDGDSLRSYNVNNSNFMGIVPLDFFIDLNNNKWVSSSYNGISILNGNNTTKFISRDISFPLTSIGSILVGKNNEIIIAGSNQFPPKGFIAKYNSQLKKWDADSNDLASSITGNIIFDGNNNIVGMVNSFLVSCINNTWAIDSNSSGIFGYIKSLKLNRKNQLVEAGKNGYSTLVQGNWNPTYINFGEINDLFVDDSNIMWVCGEKLFKILDSNNYITYSSQDLGFIDPVYFKTMQKDRFNNYWVGTNHGIFKYDGQTWINFNTSNSGIGRNYVSCIAIDQNDKIWCGGFSKSDTLSEGLSSFDGINWEVFNTQNSPLVNNSINDIKVDKNNVKWISTYDGLYSLTDYPLSISESEQQRHFTISIYPNPAKDELYVEGTKSSDYISVFDILGVQQSLKIDNTNSKIYLNNLNSGLYILKVKSGNQFETIKFLKQ